MLARRSECAKENWSLLVDSWMRCHDNKNNKKSQKTSLINRHEALSIIQRALILERRIERNQKQPNDFIKYVQFCDKLIDLFKLRQKISDIPIKQLFVVLNDLIKLGNRALRIYLFRNQGDKEMWKAYLIFNIKHASKVRVSQIYARVLNVHSNDFYFVIEAIKWEYQKMRNFDTARKLLHRYLDRFPNDSSLWKEYLDLEIAFVKQLRNSKNFAANLGIDPNNLIELTQGALVCEVIKEIKNNQVHIVIDASKMDKRIMSEFKNFFDTKWIQKSKLPEEQINYFNFLSHEISNIKNPVMHDIEKKFCNNYIDGLPMLSFDQQISILLNFFDAIGMNLKSFREFKITCARLFAFAHSHQNVYACSLLYYLKHNKISEDWYELFYYYCQQIINPQDFTDLLVKLFISNDFKLSESFDNSFTDSTRQVCIFIIQQVLAESILSTSNFDSYAAMVNCIQDNHFQTNLILVDQIIRQAKSKLSKNSLIKFLKLI